MLETILQKGFGSDNHSGVHPELLKSIIDCNKGHLPSYGTDPYCQKANKQFQKLFSKPCSTFFVFNGTAANTLSLKSMVNSYNSILCSDIAHANVDECGAPEFFSGGKLVPIKSKNGKITAQQIKENLIRLGDQHFSQPKALTITQPTELGTIYSQDELKELIKVAKENNLYVHIDGARIANCIASLETDFSTFFADLEIDILSFGGTKNAFLFGEAVVIFNKDLAKDFKYIRKQGLNLPSKSRFIAAQFIRYFKSNLWKEIANHSNQMAKFLEEQLLEIPEIEITYPVQANAVFAKIPKDWVKRLKKSHFFYIWDENSFEARLMCSFDTTREDISAFIRNIELIKKERCHEETPAH